jgi:hypothetical protein
MGLAATQQLPVRRNGGGEGGSAAWPHLQKSIWGILVQSRYLIKLTSNRRLTGRA